MNDKDGASSANIDTFQKIAYVSTVSHKTILTKLPRVKIIPGIRDIMIKCNASIRELKRILNIDIWPGLRLEYRLISKILGSRFPINRHG